ncbi:MAG: glutaminase A [Anaerolineae bacterium]
MVDLQALIDDLHVRYQPLNAGTVATYIPELAKANLNWFGIAIVTADGTVYHAGDSEKTFTIQSVSKPFTYGIALEDCGREQVLEKVAVEPVGKTFNAIVLDESTGRPPNPMINAGAIAIGDLIKGETLTNKLTRLLAKFKQFAGREVHMDAPVFTSERLTSHRNRAITNLLYASGTVTGEIEEVLDFYIQQCSLSINAVDLATMAGTLANQGVNPITGERALEKTYVRDVLSVMYSCGMYDSSGEWAYRVGIPAKSGVSGGLIGIVPQRMGIAVFSPPLDERGHSVRGLKVFEELSKALCLHVFDWSQPD